MTREYELTKEIITNCVTDPIRGFTKGLLAVPSFFSSTGSFGESKSSKNFDHKPSDVGYFIGGMIPIGATMLNLGVVFPSLWYCALIRDHPLLGTSLLATHLTTNALSGAYEYINYRNRKENGEEKTPVQMVKGIFTGILNSNRAKDVQEEEPLVPELAIMYTNAELEELLRYAERKETSPMTPPEIEGNLTLETRL